MTSQDNSLGRLDHLPWWRATSKLDYRPVPLLFRYGIAVGAVGLATGTRFLLTPLWGESDYPFAFYYVAIALSAWLGRGGPGLFAIALSGFAANYFFMQPIHLLAFTTSEAVALLVFMASALLIVMSIQAMHWSNDGIRKALAELTAADRQKSEFLALLAHELRNPLAPLSSALYLLKRSAEGNAQLQQVSAVIKRQLDQLVRLVDDLLDVARATRGKLELESRTIDLAESVVRAIETARPLIDAKGHALEVSLPRQPVYVVGDMTRLSQAISNLLMNAAKYSRVRSRIELTLKVQGGNAVLCVRDEGKGIAPELLPRIFDLFVQGDKALARSDGGLGIGLTLVKGLIELHGGEVRAHSEGPGKGSEFVIVLPLAPADARSPGETPEPVAPAPAGRTRTVLIVDDNADAANGLASMLETMGHRVSVEYDGMRTLASAEKMLPDVILLDIGLPGLDGYEVARLLRANPSTQHIRLIAVTGYGQVEDRARSLRAGIDHHLVKPVAPEMLNRLITAP